jgi:DNA gyrase subunit A
MGIAVGMATNIPPHNLGEVIDGCIAYIDNRDITIDEIMEYVKGPDFPTGAKILGNSGIKKAYETGRGSITLRAKASIEQQNDRDQIIITEVPYNVNTLDLKKKIGELVRDKVIEGISDLHEETNLENGLKIVITLKKDANANVVLNNLYKHTQLQSNFGIILLMLDQGEPKTLNIKEIISKYVEYQKEIIIRRTKFDLEKAENRFHILEGLKIALDNIDEVIATIKKSKADGEAKVNLISKFGLSELQAEAILEMKLRRLTGLEREKIDEELKELTKLIESLKALLASEEQIYNTIKEELTEIKNKYSDDRRTEIDMTAIEFIEDESLIPEENIVVMLTREGYVKRVNPDDFKVQNRGGVGIKGMTTNEDDNVEEIIYLSTHDHLLFFSNRGKVYRLKGYEVPLYSRQAKGIPIVNLLQIEKEEVITSLIKIPQENTKPYLLFVTEKGVVKKTEVSEFESIRQTGKIAITLREGDQLISVRNTTGSDMILLASNAGRMVKFSEEEVRSMGRTATGVRGINLEDSKCIGAAVVNDDDIILMLTEKGYGKRNRVEDFRQTRRGSKGVKALNITDKNGTIVYFRLLTNQEELIIITNEGITIRIPISQIPLLGRVTQGLRVINLRANQKVTTAVLVANDEVTDENEE